MAGSQLRALGLPELVSHSLQAYEALALELAQRPALLAQVRARLSVNRGTQPLFDVARYTRALEALFFKAWDEHQQGQGSDAVKWSVSQSNAT